MKRVPYLSVALISASALAYEILLMQLFSIIQRHHFAYMIISLALLGYGASGTFLTLARERMLNHFPTAYLGNIILFSLSSMLCFHIARQIPFDPLEILWEMEQLLWLLCLYLLLALPYRCQRTFTQTQNGDGAAVCRVTFGSPVLRTGQ